MDVIGHIILALVTQALVAWFCRSWSAGAAAATAWAISREITQAEYRWIEAYGGGLRANMPWWGGLDPLVWNKADPWLDWLLPTVVTISVAMLARRRPPGGGTP